MLAHGFRDFSPCLASYIAFRPLERLKHHGGWARKRKSGHLVVAMKQRGDKQGSEPT
jgi:hypothetical protein